MAHADMELTPRARPTWATAPATGPPAWLMSAVRRGIHLLLVLLLVSFGTFVLLDLAPQDPAVAILGDRATPEEIAQIHQELGLDDPVLVRYGHWLGDAVHGDLGTSLVAPFGSVMDRIRAALPISLELALLGEIIALVVAIPLAVWSAYKDDGVVDRLSTRVTFGLLSVPVFVSGLVLALLFSLHWKLFPRAGWIRLTSQDGVVENLRHAVLPSVALALPLVALFTQVLRAEMAETLQEDYIQAARAKGLPPWRILLRHALRPSSLSLVTLSGVSLGYLIGGAVLVESIYGLPGLGRVLADAVGASDYPLVQGIVLIIAVAYVLINALVDVLYAVLDPRIRHERR
jgi:peptide/nickel transport system permease protein